MGYLKQSLPTCKINIILSEKELIETNSTLNLFGNFYLKFLWLKCHLLWFNFLEMYSAFALKQANDVIFCGRILMFLAHFFPLSERSGIFCCSVFMFNFVMLIVCGIAFLGLFQNFAAVNIKGVFNTSNDTKYEKDPPLGTFRAHRTLLIKFQVLIFIYYLSESCLIVDTNLSLLLRNFSWFQLL